MKKSSSSKAEPRIRRPPAVARREIVEAARAEIEESSDGRISVSAVMRRVGMRQSSFYHYFKSLDEVILELLLDLEADVKDAVEPWLQGRQTSTDRREDTVVHLTAMLAAGRRHRRVLSAAIRAANSSEKIYSQWKSRILDFYFDQAKEFIEKQVEEGRSNVSDPASAARALVFMNFGAWMDDLWRDNPTSPSELGRTVGSVWNDVIYGNAP
ncbi:MAG: TetR/AcrR family transcriptional regulator [Pseudomonadota bacterium]